MAKKKKQDDDINEDFDMDSSGDINEADDNFGLPDVDYEPLETPESSEAKEEPKAEETPKEEKPVETPKREGMGRSTSYESESSTYEAPKGDSVAGKIVTFAILLIIAAGAVWYFGFYKPKQAAKEKARLEQQEKARKDSLNRVAQQQKLAAAEQARQDSLARIAEQPEEPEVGQMTTISQRTGRYYIIIGSFIDDDMAKDYADKLGQEGHNTSLIAPWGNRKFYRLAIADLASLDEATTKMDELKGTYGDGLWVLKH